MAIGMIAAWLFLAPTQRPSPQAITPRLAVLPFESLGEANEATFAAGLVDELTDRLARDGRLVVVAREIRATPPSETGGAVEVGRRLEVDYVLTGSLRWGPTTEAVQRVRVTAQLIAVRDATVVFSNTLDLAVEDVFAMHSAIADLVMSHLGAALPATAAASPAPTPLPEAYRLFLRSREHDSHFDSPESQFLSQSLLVRATEVDPRFAQGWAALALVRSRINHLGYDRTAAQRAAAEDAAQRALALAPDDPAVRTAYAGFLYFVREDYSGALEALAAAERFLPQRAAYSELRGYLLRRLGRWEEALAALQEARERSPDSAWLVCETGITRMALGRFAAADADFSQAIAMSPDLQAAYEWRAHNTLLWTRNPAAARDTLRSMPAAPRASPALESWFISLCERRYDEALRALEPLSAAGSPHRWYFFPRSLLDAQVQLLTGDAAGARRSFGEAHTAIERHLADNPEDHRAHAALGLALAGLGRGADAARAVQHAVSMCPVERDAVRGGFYLEALARVHVLNGELDQAVQVLERLLAQPVFPQALPLLDLDPRWAPLQGHPRYPALLATSLSPTWAHTAATAP